MKKPKLSLTWIRILIGGILISGVIFTIQTGALKNISQKIRTAVWRPNIPWSLEIRQTFLKCGHQLQLINKYPSDITIQGYLKRHPECRIYEKQEHGLVCAESVVDFCPNCRNKQFLGIRDHEVVVIRGTPGHPGPVKEKTIIQIKLLPPAELADLQKGIPFEDEQEKLQIIEGLNGLVTN